jgi:hypothetical protein
MSLSVSSGDCGGFRITPSLSAACVWWGVGSQKANTCMITVLRAINDTRIATMSQMVGFIPKLRETVSLEKAASAYKNRVSNDSLAGASIARLQRNGPRDRMNAATAVLYVGSAVAPHAVFIYNGIVRSVT